MHLNHYKIYPCFVYIQMRQYFVYFISDDLLAFSESCHNWISTFLTLSYESLGKKTNKNGNLHLVVLVHCYRKTNHLVSAVDARTRFNKLWRNDIILLVYNLITLWTLWIFYAILVKKRTSLSFNGHTWIAININCLFAQLNQNVTFQKFLFKNSPVFLNFVTTSTDLHLWRKDANLKILVVLFFLFRLITAERNQVTNKNRKFFRSCTVKR